MNEIDEEFLKEVEGFTYKFYIPKDKNGKPLEKSSWTIGNGIDLGQHSSSELIKKGIPIELVSKISKLLGTRGKNYKGKLPELTKQEIEILSDVVTNNEIETLKNKLGKIWDELQPEVRTVALSLYHQFGNKLFRYNAWRQIKTKDIQGLIKNLRDFGDNYPTRRNKEADLIEGAYNGKESKSRGS